ncbi:MAG TPA: HAD hydrolase family protein, partial [Terriglobales bacterium]|nr:HAD hydrolase family protein [Terriglobales bacterium]
LGEHRDGWPSVPERLLLSTRCLKGDALERWANHRGVPREQVMAIDDNYNDVEMLAFAGRPFIMGNAPAELHERGWTVTLSNAENGVAAAIEQVLDGHRSESRVPDPAPAG